MPIAQVHGRLYAWRLPDMLRRAMGKKKPEEWPSSGPEFFLEGWRNQQYQRRSGGQYLRIWFEKFLLVMVQQVALAPTVLCPTRPPG